MFKRKARDNVKIRNLPKVLFLCHPESPDYQEVIQALLKIDNICVVYNDETSFENLTSRAYETVQLCFVYVDETFINKEDDKLLEFINSIRMRKLHLIPIISSEKYLNEFTELLGEIQYISFEDKTKFKKKIKEAFNIYLFEEDIAFKIKANFSSFVFVSYRHKDLEDAYQVISAIHRDKKNQNIGIWYDDFLTVGENFNSEIEEEIKNADGFVLTTTPNLVNEDNYVRQIEYKIATYNNKKIIPIETNETNRELLQEQYENIPDCISINNQNEIDKKISSSFPTSDLDSPRQKYYLGVAYLKGIYVEKNFDRATSLLEEAMDEDYLPAILQLEQIYEYGIGINIDLAKAIYYQRRIIDNVIRANEKPITIASTKLHLAVLLINSFKESDEIESLLYESINILDKNNPEHYFRIAHCYNMLLTYYVTRYSNESREKSDALIKEIESFTEKLIDSKNAALNDEIANLYIATANHYYSKNEYQLSERYALKGLSFNEKALKDDFNGNILTYLRAIINIGGYLSEFAPASILPYFKKGVEAYNSFIKYHESNEMFTMIYLQILSLFYFSESRLGIDVKDKVKEIDEIMAGVDISKSLYLKMQRIQILRKVADSLTPDVDHYQFVRDRYLNLINETISLIKEIEANGGEVAIEYYSLYHCYFMLAQFESAITDKNDIKGQREILNYLELIDNISQSKIKIDSYRIDNTFGLFEFYRMYLSVYACLKDKENTEKYFNYLINSSINVKKLNNNYSQLEPTFVALCLGGCLLDRVGEVKEFIDKIAKADVSDKRFTYHIYQWSTHGYLAADGDKRLLGLTKRYLNAALTEMENNPEDDDLFLETLATVDSLIKKTKENNQLNAFLELVGLTSEHLVTLVKRKHELLNSQLTYDYVYHLVFLIYRTCQAEILEAYYVNSCFDLFAILMEAYFNLKADQVPVPYGAASLFLGYFVFEHERLQEMPYHLLKSYANWINQYEDFYHAFTYLSDMVDDHDYENVGSVIDNAIYKMMTTALLSGPNYAYMYQLAGDYLLEKEARESAFACFSASIDLLNDDNFKMVDEKTMFEIYASSFLGMSLIKKYEGDEESEKEYYECYLKAKNAAENL